MQWSLVFKQECQEGFNKFPHLLSKAQAGIVNAISLHHHLPWSPSVPPKPHKATSVKEHHNLPPLPSPTVSQPNTSMILSLQHHCCFKLSQTTSALCWRMTMESQWIWNQHKVSLKLVRFYGELITLESVSYQTPLPDLGNWFQIHQSKWDPQRFALTNKKWPKSCNKKPRHQINATNPLPAALIQYVEYLVQSISTSTSHSDMEWYQFCTFYSSISKVTFLK